MKWQVERRKAYHSNRLGMLNSLVETQFSQFHCSCRSRFSHWDLRAEIPQGSHKGSLLAYEELMSIPAGGLRWPRTFPLPPRTQRLDPEAEASRRTRSRLEGVVPPSWSEWLRRGSNIRVSPTWNIPIFLPKKQPQFSQASVDEDPKTHLTPLVKRKMEKKLRHCDK